MTKVIFIATLWLLTALRAAGVPVMPAAPEPRCVPLDGALLLHPSVSLNRLDEAEFPTGSAPGSVAEWRPASESTPFSATHQVHRVAVLLSTSIEVARRPRARDRGRRERRFGPHQKFFRGAQAWLDRKQP